MRKILFLMSFLCLFYIRANSQGSISGKIIDSVNKQGLGYATISIFEAADTSLVSYRLSTPEGVFKVPGIPFNLKCRILISFSGYSVYRQEITFTASQPTIDLGTIKLGRDARELDDVLVYAERPPVVVRKDTIEFNTSSFKTLPTALVEDLLKKLPGVEVDRDGNIQVNGKPVNRILVDGKTFFGNDPKMATRNLPANIVDKVQVVDDLEELQRKGDDNMMNIGKVINLTLRKGVKKGWFGKLYGGAGNKKLYEGGAIANVFRDTLQVSVLGYLNNLNKAAFTLNEFLSAGGFDRMRSNSTNNETFNWNNNGGGSGVSLNGVNFGGYQGASGGVATSKGAGFNLNHAPSTKRSFYLQYFFGHFNADRLTVNDVDQYKQDTVINNHSTLTGPNFSSRHNAAAGLRIKPDSLTNIVFNISLVSASGTDGRYTDIISSNNKIGTLSTGHITVDIPSTINIYRSSASVTLLSPKKKGRRSNIDYNLQVTDRDWDNTTQSTIHFFNPTVYDSVSTQLRSEKQVKTDFFIGHTYNDPWKKNKTLRLYTRYEYNKLDHDVKTYNKGVSGGFDAYNSGLSNQIDRTMNRFTFVSGIEFKHKKLTITPGFRTLAQLITNEFRSLNTTIKQNSFDILPYVNGTWKDLNFNFSRNATWPDYNYLIPVNDNINPYYISKGNPNLEPGHSNVFNIFYFKNDIKKTRVINARTFFNFVDNDIVQSVSVDARGVQTNMPVNADGSKFFNANFYYYKQYKNKQKLIFSWSARPWFGLSHTKLIFNDATTWQNTINTGANVNVSLNWQDKIELTGGIFKDMDFTSYSSDKFKDLDAKDFGGNAELVIRYPKHVIWESQVNFNRHDNPGGGIQKNECRLNCAINFTMLKEERGVLKFALYDALDQSANITYYAQGNTITTSQTNVLHRYFMVTFSYDVRASGAKKKIGGRDSLFRF